MFVGDADELVRAVLAEHVRHASVGAEHDDVDGRRVEHHVAELHGQRARQVTVRDRDRAHGGAGIGLAIVKQLVEAAGGRVGADSTDGRTRFWFSLTS